VNKTSPFEKGGLRGFINKDIFLTVGSVVLRNCKEYSWQDKLSRNFLDREYRPGSQPYPYYRL
jgi:hypothetical protein